MMKNRIYTFLFLAITILFLYSCNEDAHYIPKPPTYLEVSFPDRTYSTYVDSCGYSLQKPSYFKFSRATNFQCNRNIELEGLDGEILLSDITMDTTLAAYINHAIDKMDRHKIKATAILDTSIIRENDNVYGTFFELQGNVATPFQFYLTDSTQRFISGVVYFNTIPNYDSIKPVLNFVKKDIFKMMNTLKWKPELN